MEEKYDHMQKQLSKTEKKLSDSLDKEEHQRQISAQLRADLDSAESEIDFLVILCF